MYNGKRHLDIFHQTGQGHHSSGHWARLAAVGGKRVESKQNLELGDVNEETVPTKEGHPPALSRAGLEDKRLLES